MVTFKKITYVIIDEWMGMTCVLKILKLCKIYSGTPGYHHNCRGVARP